MSIVWTNGTFDILHPGHIQLFKVARSLGDKVIVATDTDAKIKKDKGDHKPINEAVTNGVLIHYSGEPNAVTAITDTPDIDNSMHSSLIDYVKVYPLVDKKICNEIIA